ncbi:hypothetical protein [Kribbella sp. CA-293567]|uniref:hypothetical protein n=1 Tax=Kribbella sp. CA-293567 TaxID=3002436 RepID=UPI0022DDAB97|nr:hypothetical protein [Kribbella sp. CA-293567]WBQ04381.1 hypothetical protein OX958_31005 [Kribbella sp. CA-293567]
MTTKPLAIDDWVPQACTLPTAEQPLRNAEFDHLFATGLLGLDRLAPTRLQLRLDAATEATARDLAARETTCCSFFAFDYAPAADGELLVEVSVPTAHVAVLDALATRAAATARLAA